MDQGSFGQGDWAAEVDPFAAFLEAAEALRRDAERLWVPEPHQVPPEGLLDGSVAYWMLVAGRGAGKTDAGSHYLNTHATGPACLRGDVPHRMAIIAPTNPDAQKTCVMGDSGLLQANPNIDYRPGSLKQSDLKWPDGSEASLYGAYQPEDPERLRGPQHCLIWAEEFAAWRYLDDTWNMARLGLRLGPHPHAIFTTTPRPRPLLIKMMKDPLTRVSTATTDDNPHLAQVVRQQLYDIYGGTRLGQQELRAKILSDAPGALWTRDDSKRAEKGLIQYGTFPTIKVLGPEGVELERPNLAKVVVAVDPAASAHEGSDETGIVVVGAGYDRRGYVLDDWSLLASPEKWARAAIQAYRNWEADYIVAEANNGGDMVRATIRAMDANVPIKLVHASRGKTTRAEPIAAMYQQDRWVHTKVFDALEDQMCTWEQGDKDSPDRMDALVWGGTEILVDLGGSDGWIEYMRSQLRVVA